MLVAPRPGSAGLGLRPPFEFVPANRRRQALTRWRHARWSSGSCDPRAFIFKAEGAPKEKWLSRNHRGRQASV